MKKRILGKTGISVTEIGVGAWQLGGPLKLDGKTDGHPELGREFCIGLIRQCGEIGINFVDTAEQYGNGESERRVGEAVKGRRGQWVISTKFGYQVGPNGERLVDASPARVPVSLEGSLKRLQTDYIDVYLYHCHTNRADAEKAAEYLLDRKQKGVIRAIGMSANNLEQFQTLHSLGCLDVVQFHDNLMSTDRSVRDYLAANQIGGIVRGAFHAGRLSGRYFHTPPKFSPDDIRSNISAETQRDYTRYAAFEELLTPERGMIQLALRWLLDDSATTTIIPGGKNIDDYHNAIRATEIAPLTPAEKERIAQLRAQILQNP